MGTKITIGMFLRTKEEYGTAIIVPANIGKGVVLEQLREIVLALETEDPAATVKGAHALIIYSDGGLNVVFLESAEEKAKMIEELAEAKREFTAHGVGG